MAPAISQFYIMLASSYSQIIRGVRKYSVEFLGGTKMFPASVKNPHTPYLPLKVSTPLSI